MNGNQCKLSLEPETFSKVSAKYIVMFKITWNKNILKYLEYVQCKVFYVTYINFNDFSEKYWNVIF